MAYVIDSIETDQYALFNGDSTEVLAELPGASVDLSVYSPPFSDLLRYSSSDRDLGNSRTHEEFLEHYSFIVREIYRLTRPGRMSAVHCMDLAKTAGTSTSGKSPLRDFSGDIIRLHQEAGFDFWDRRTIFKEPLMVAMRTRALALRHYQVVKDASWCRSALPDYLLFFRKPGEPEVPISHENGFTYYPGTLPIYPPTPGWEAEWAAIQEEFKDFDGDQAENKLSHYIWRRLASPIWDDVRSGRVLPYRESKDEEAERHVCPLQLDVIERAVMLYSNPGEVVLTPFLGVGSEAYVAVQMGRRAIGCELKPAYYVQAVRNVEAGLSGWADEHAQEELF